MFRVCCAGYTVPHTVPLCGPSPPQGPGCPPRGVETEGGQVAGYAQSLGQVDGQETQQGNVVARSRWLIKLELFWTGRLVVCSSDSLHA